LAFAPRLRAELKSWFVSLIIATSGEDKLTNSRPLDDSEGALPSLG
jgi:hypothetical protein